MTMKELKKLIRKAGRKGDVYLKFGDELISADIENCGYRIDRDGNVTIIIGAAEDIEERCGEKVELEP